MREFVKKRPLGRDSTESSSSEEMARSTPPRDVLELGTHLVHELGLQNSTDTLGRWLAHHLGELMSEAENKRSAAGRRIASTRAANLILKIWERRALLPGNTYPLAPYKDILKALSILGPDTGQWQRGGRTRYHTLAATIYDRLRRIVIGLLLVDVAPILELKAPKRNSLRKFLSADERAILRELNRLVEAMRAGSDLAADRSERQHIDVRESLRTLADDAIKHLGELRELLSARSTAQPRKGGAGQRHT